MDKIDRIIRESIDNVLSEDIPAFDVFNGNISLSEMGSILNSYLYNGNGQCVGRLRDLHFKYDSENNHMLGSSEGL